mmetsp:Transcript_10861/g.32554  ORF Transcript_10861/g.32554 Transcript_10861/m.32554 type:complete len:382 (+) Transcript_10861:1002-2147(+)
MVTPDKVGSCSPKQCCAAVVRLTWPSYPRSRNTSARSTKAGKSARPTPKDRHSLPSSDELHPNATTTRPGAVRKASSGGGMCSTPTNRTSSTTVADDSCSSATRVCLSSSPSVSGTHSRSRAATPLAMDSCSTARPASKSTAGSCTTRTEAPAQPRCMPVNTAAAVLMPPWGGRPMPFTVSRSAVNPRSGAATATLHQGGFPRTTQAPLQQAGTIAPPAARLGASHPPLPPPPPPPPLPPSPPPPPPPQSCRLPLPLLRMRGALMVLTNAVPENGLPQPLLPPSDLRGALSVPMSCRSGEDGPVLLLPPPLMRECCKGPGAHPELPLLSCRGGGAGSAVDPLRESPLPLQCPLLLPACKCCLLLCVHVSLSGGLLNAPLGS